MEIKHQTGQSDEQHVCRRTWKYCTASPTVACWENEFPPLQVVIALLQEMSPSVVISSEVLTRSGPNSVHHKTSASLASSPCLTRGSAHLVVLQALPAATTSPPRLPDSSQLHSFPVHPSLLDSLELVPEKLSLWRLRFLAESQIH